MAAPLRYEVLAVLSALVLTACRSAGPPPMYLGRPGSDGHLEEPYVAAQSEFTITLVEPMERHPSATRRSFLARVEYPVRSPENEIVIQTNAFVRGEVVEIETTPLLLVKLRFDEVETITGPARLSATVRTAEPYALLSWIPGPHEPRFDAALYPLGNVPGGEASSDGHVAAVGGGPPDALERTSPPILPAGTRMRLVLHEPIVPPRRPTAIR